MAPYGAISALRKGYPKRPRMMLLEVMPQNYRVILVCLLVVGSLPRTHRLRKRARSGRSLRPDPHHVRHKLDPCPGSAPYCHEKPLESVVPSISLISEPIQMADISSWVSNPGESNGPLMSVVTWCLVAVSGTFLGVRLWIRQNAGKLWIDDCTLGIAWVSAIVFRRKRQSTYNA